MSLQRADTVRKRTPAFSPLAAVAALALSLPLAACDPPGWSYPTGYDVFTAPQGYDTSGANAFLAVAAASMPSDKTDKAANLATLEGIVVDVMLQFPDTDVIVFPELCTSWLIDPESPAAYYASVAETIPGPSTDTVAGYAAAYGVAIVFGMAETSGGLYYNSQVLVQPDGSLVTYRKRGLNDGDIRNGCTPGSGVVNSIINGVGVSFLICSDYQDADVIRDLSVNPAPVVLASLVTSTRLNERVDFLARSISRWVVYSNGCGTQAYGTNPGFVFIADPTGTVRTMAQATTSFCWMRIGVYQ